MIKSKSRIFVANWKMNKTPKEAKFFMEEFFSYFKTYNLEKTNNLEVIFCVPFLDIGIVLESIERSNCNNVFVGAQNCYFEDTGAFTGEISAFMLKNVGVGYVILGHSERRDLFSEKNSTINKKVLSCLRNNLKVILCVGESFSQKKFDITDEIIEAQVKEGLSSVKKEDLENIILSYEPVWAIGTSKSASTDEVKDVVNFIRRCVSSLFDEETGNSLPILYGGSLNGDNASNVLKSCNIDGAIVGRASLNSRDFLNIVRKC